MKLEFFIARRYLFSKKSSNAVNVISWISVFSIAISTFALITVLSAFNGLQELVESLYESFEPDVRITPAKGKWIDQNDFDFASVSNVDGVEHSQKVLEELTLARYGEYQSPCTMKGIEESFIGITKLKEHIVEGEAALNLNGHPAALVGFGLSGTLKLYIDDFTKGLKLYVPRLASTTIMDPSQAFFTKSINPSGVFLINPDIDQKYLLVPLEFAQEFIQKEGNISAVELKVEEDMENEVKSRLTALLGKKFKVETRFELNKIIYQTNKAEKIVTFVILTFILLISAFNVISTLTMILLEKKEDIRTYQILGLERNSIRRIFLNEGLMINFIGALSGLLLGTVLCILQMKFGLVRLEGGIVEYYPVKLLWLDFALILGIVFVIGVLASYLPSRILLKK